MPIPAILCIKPILEITKENKYIPINLPNGLSYNVSTEKIKRVYVKDDKGKSYNARFGIVVGTENKLCFDKYSEQNFTGYDVHIVSFTDRKNKINDVIISSGKFINQANKQIFYIYTLQSDKDRVQNYFEKNGYVEWLMIFIIFCRLY